jgi:hypothetical protein
MQPSVKIQPTLFPQTHSAIGKLDDYREIFTALVVTMYQSPVALIERLLTGRTPVLYQTRPQFQKYQELYWHNSCSLQSRKLNINIQQIPQVGV